MSDHVCDYDLSDNDSIIQWVCTICKQPLKFIIKDYEKDESIMNIKLSNKELIKLSSALGFACGIMKGLNINNENNDLLNKAISDIHKIHDLIIDSIV